MGLPSEEIAAIRANIARRKTRDLVFGAIGVLCLVIVLLTMAALFADMIITGWDRFRPGFFTDFPSRRAAQAGILSAWVGSVLVMIVTAVVAVPLGVAAGIWLEEYAPKHWVTDVIEININNLAGVPSIIYGLLALGLFVYTFGLGQSVRTAGLTLALLILPVVIVATREAIRSIPQMIREAAYGLGATKWQTVKDHVVPYSLPGILTGMILAIARGAGEVAPLMLTGVSKLTSDAPVDLEFPFVHFERKFMHLGFHIYDVGFQSPNVEAVKPMVYMTAALLLILIVALNLTAILYRNRIRRRLQTALF